MTDHTKIQRDTGYSVDAAEHRIAVCFVVLVVFVVSAFVLAMVAAVCWRGSQAIARDGLTTVEVPVELPATRAVLVAP